VRKTLTACFLFSITVAFAQSRTDNVIIITLDGFRWQELFAGADPTMLFNKEFCSNPEVQKQFWDSSALRRREKLLPFFWNVIGKEGQLYGNRKLNNRVNCSNPHWFSYPGYSEMFTGLVDRRVRSNDSIVNPNYTVLEHINSQERYKGKVAAFSTWEVIPYIIRAQEAGIFTKCGRETVTANLDSASRKMSLELQRIFRDSVEAEEDFSTFYSAFNYLKKERPKVLYIGFDKTDEHAHVGDYDQYLRSAYATDRMIQELWNWIQTNEDYKDKTTLILTTDHGRGKKVHRWKKHGRHIFGSGQMWFAVIGPDTPAHGEIKTKGQYYQKQFAKTIASFIGLDYSNTKGVGSRIYGMTISNHVATGN
jgi:hypothetical protein